MATSVTIPLALALVLGAAAPTSDQMKKVEEWTAKSTVVFRGTVKRLKDSTLKDPKVLTKASLAHVIVVQIDELVDPSEQAKKMFAVSVGNEITVYDRPSGDLPELKVGDRAVFYANAWLFGDNIAVRTVGRTPVAKEIAAGGPVVAQVSKRAEAQLAANLARADAVITGKVVSVRALQDPRQRAVAAATPSQNPISEHDPQWREAIVEVQSVEKGNIAQKRVSVVFAASRDVAWYKSPKFKKDQEGLIVLHSKQIANEQLNAALVTSTPADVASGIERVFTAIDPNDFIAGRSGAIENVKSKLKTIK